MIYLLNDWRFICTTFRLQMDTEGIQYMSKDVCCKENNKEGPFKELQHINMFRVSLDVFSIQFHVRLYDF